MKAANFAEGPFQQVKIIFYALALGQIMFFAVALFVVSTGNISASDTVINLFNIIVPVFTLGALIVSRISYQKLADKEKKIGGLEKKISSYRKNNIIKWALIEGATFLTLAAFMLTGDFLYAIIVVIILLYFFVNMPSHERFKIEYELSQDEIDQLNSI